MKLFVWSWAPGQPANVSQCPATRSDGRWQTIVSLHCRGDMR